VWKDSKSMTTISQRFRVFPKLNNQHLRLESGLGHKPTKQFGIRGLKTGWKLHFELSLVENSALSARLRVH